MPTKRKGTDKIRRATKLFGKAKGVGLIKARLDESLKFAFLVINTSQCLELGG